MEAHILRKQGLGIRAIARCLGVSRNTVRAMLKTERQDGYRRRQSGTTKLQRYQSYLQHRLHQPGGERLASTVLMREICEQGYTGGISLLRSFVADIRPKKPQEPIVRFETPPGDQMQIDFVVFRRGKSPLRAFTATLGYSRMSFVEFTDNERVETWISCLEHAFQYFGGVPRSLLCDNPKTIVLERHAYGDGKHRYHQAFYDFAKHYSCKIYLCRPYRAQTKGKVERFHRYLRESFYVPLETRMIPVVLDVDTANREVRSWLEFIANSRIHATLKERPVDRFEQERLHLEPLPLPYSGKSLRILSSGTNQRLKVPLPTESLQHPLAKYAEFC